MKATIYQKSKNAMQSGRAKAGVWILEYETDTRRTPEPLMGWTQSDDTIQQVKIKFDTLEKAQAYAQDKGLQYSVLPAHGRRIKPRNYVDNFRYIPPKD